MKRRIEIVIFLCIIAAGAALLFLSEPPSRDEAVDWGAFSHQQVITIRNLTEEAVIFSLETPDSTENPVEHHLARGETYQVPTSGALEIYFERAGREDSYRLEAGQPYNFRYDENHLIQIYQGSHGRSDAADLAPFVSTPMEIVETMLELAEVSADDILYDLGCGDGRIVIMAAKTCGARGVGVDIDPVRIRECEERSQKEGVDGMARFILEDATKVDFSEATVVTLYLLPESNALLVPLFEKNLMPGTRVVSHNYHIPGWEHKETESLVVTDLTGEEHSLFLYLR